MGSSTKPEKRRRDADDIDGDNNNSNNNDGGAAIERKAKKSKTSNGDKKKDKKAKKPREEPSALPELDADEAGEQAQNQDEDGAQPKPATATPSKKKKKNKKAKKPAQPKDEDEANTEAANPEAGENNEEVEQDQERQQHKPSGKKSRFIVFVGNLPYSATVAEIQAHFASLQPTSVRLLHEKTNPSKSRGIAFVEFAGYDHMKTCLRTMHHSTFTGTATNPKTGKTWTDERRINVELTAGGGGNTAARKDKIRAKNVKLNEERGRRMEAEEKAKWERRSNNAVKQQGGEQEQAGGDGIHPSRRGRVHGGGGGGGGRR